MLCDEMLCGGDVYSRERLFSLCGLLQVILVFALYHILLSVSVSTLAAA